MPPKVDRGAMQEALLAIRQLTQGVKAGDPAALAVATAIKDNQLASSPVLESLANLQALKQAVLRGDPTAIDTARSQAVTDAVTAIGAASGPVLPKP